jgi:UDP-2-acetamido-3-amino-2,3-dideoxy-glucuronate N-acetyltransferase
MKPAFFQHPAALVETRQIGAGTRIWAYAHVMKGAKIGKQCNIGDHCFIEPGVRVGDGVTIKNGVSLWEGVTLADFVFVGPHAAFTNDLRPRSPRFPGAAVRYESKSWVGKTHVGRGATIGANATIVCGIRIGAFAMIGAGAVTTKDVPEHALWLGVPGKLSGFVCECGEKLKIAGKRATCPLCRKRYIRRGHSIRRSK